jgi:type IV pilus assembly protein PilN
MIKINLLPTKKKAPKKVIDLQQQGFLALLILALVFIGMFLYWQAQENKIAMLKNDKAAAERRIADQDNMLKEVKNVEKERANVQEKIGIIKKLKKNQSGPVLLLDVVSTALPKGVGVTSLSEKNNVVSLSGNAFSNENVVKYIDNLKASPLLKDVMLLETKQMTTKDKVDIYKYKLKFVYKGL